jgi:hypothetical protein
MAKRKKVIMDLSKAEGKLPSEDTDKFEEIMGLLIANWHIERPQEIMLVNRMVSTWMKMRKVESLIAKYDLYFEKTDKDGKVVGIDMNQLAYYLRVLESDFRNYYKVLQSRESGVPTKVQDFGSYLQDLKKVEDENHV